MGVYSFVFILFCFLTCSVKAKRRKRFNEVLNESGSPLLAVDSAAQLTDVHMKSPLPYDSSEHTMTDTEKLTESEKL